MVAVPPAIPVTTPPLLTVAMPAALLLHVPPPVAHASVAVAPWHSVTAVAGVIAAGVANTVTDCTAEHPLTVYDIVHTPAVTPVTTPPATVAMPGLELLHAPPVPVVARVVVLPIHTVGVPVITAGAGDMVIVCVFDVKSEVQVPVVVHVT